jgi:subtilisin family serine protease
MHRSFRLLIIVGMMAAALLAACSEQPSAPDKQSNIQAPLFNKTPGAEYLNDEYIVVFKDEVANVDSDVNAIVKTHGFTADHRYKSAVKGFAGKLSPAQLEALRYDPRVAYIEQDQVMRIAATQTGATWGLDRIDQASLPLSTTYTYNYTGAGVDAYIIDTGIRLTHNDFGGRALTGYDAITIGGTATDGNGHGTHVAGTVGGTTYGVAKSVMLYAIRVLDNSGNGTTSGVVAGIDWVTANHSSTRPSVANMSLGGGASSTLDAAVQTSISHGVTYCVSAGNSAADAVNYSPARVAAAITVGATTSTDGFAYYSNYGSIVDILAPGSSITSDYYSSNTATAIMSGTSMASPHVTGAAALYLEANPTATPAAVATALTANATLGKITSVPSGTVNKLLYTLFDVTPPAIPAAPVLSSPVNGATSVALPPTLSWTASTGATSYQVQVSTSSAFTTTAYDVAGLTATSASVTGLAASTIYYWRVNATNSAGTSGWSSVWSFTTAATSGSAPAAPTLISPANGATNVSKTPTLSWNASTGATSYQVQVSTSSTFTTLTRDLSGITTTSTTLATLSGRTRYYWRVNATNAYGTSVWSSVRYFTTKR